jgi:hypothetical protein
MLDPFLCVLVEAVCDVLFRNPRFDVVALHLLDDLNGVFRDFGEWSSDGAILYRPGSIS